MNVLFVITKSELGGAQTHVYQLSKYLRGKGHEVHITAFPGGWLHVQADKAGIPFHSNTALSNSLNPLKGLSAARGVAALVRRIRPDVIHCHSSAAGFWTRIAIRNSVPTLYTAHGWGFTPGTPLLRGTVMLVVERIAARFTKAFICVSEFDRKLAIERGINSAESITTIHNGIEVQKGEGSKSNRGPLKAVFVGRLSGQKEPELLIRALSELPRHIRDLYELQVIGEGPMLSDIRALVPEGITNIRIHGAIAREEVLRTLSESHLFILTSRYEGFPISILEAMSMGLAVIASDVGGIREAVTPECGILIGRGDKEALKRALTRLAEDRAAIERYGAAARERARTEFSVTAMCEKTLAVYDSIRAR